MLLKTYISIYQKDNHKAADALPKPTVAQKLSVDLNKLYSPKLGQIRTQALLADRYGLSISGLMRFEALMLDRRYSQYLPIVTHYNQRR
ncbi:hypothetical protein [Leuconostoc citreum]